MATVLSILLIIVALFLIVTVLLQSSDDDGLGAQVREGLAALGVDVKHVISAPKGMGMWLAILDEKGDLAGRWGPRLARRPSWC